MDDLESDASDLPCSERVDSLIIQNGNAYEDGLREFWDPLRAYWKDRSDENAGPLRKFLTIDGTKWQYLHGTRDPEAISPDNWTIDQARLDQARLGHKQAVAAKEVAVAARKVAAAAMAKLVVRAPFGGTVVRRSVQPGEMAAPGAPLLSNTSAAGTARSSLGKGGGVRVNESSSAAIHASMSSRRERLPGTKPSLGCRSRSPTATQALMAFWRKRAASVMLPAAPETVAKLHRLMVTDTESP